MLLIEVMSCVMKIGAFRKPNRLPFVTPKVSHPVPRRSSLSKWLVILLQIHLVIFPIERQRATNGGPCKCTNGHHYDFQTHSIGNRGEQSNERTDCHSEQ